MVDLKLEQFNERANDKHLNTWYTVFSSTEKLQKEIESHIDEEEKLFHEGFWTRKKEIWQRYWYLESNYFFKDCDTEDEEFTWSNHQGKSNVKWKWPTPFKTTFPSFISAPNIFQIMSEDLETWFECFLEASWILQYWIYFEYTKWTSNGMNVK